MIKNKLRKILETYYGNLVSSGKEGTNCCVNDIALLEIKKVIDEERLSVEEIANRLHNAGLHAYHDYSEMGKSGYLWRAFRKDLAKAISKRTGGK